MTDDSKEVIESLVISHWPEASGIKKVDRSDIVIAKKSAEVCVRGFLWQSAG